jgi:glycine hydroxymethyltransferase
MLVDVTSLEGMGGKLAEQTLDAIGITVNKNMIPYDRRKPMDPSGIRIGTPALTTRGMDQDDMKQIAAWILAALKNADDPLEISKLRREVQAFALTYPVPGLPDRDSRLDSYSLA